MKKHLYVPFIAAALLLSACGEPDSIPVKTMMISDTESTLKVGETKTLTITVLPEEATDKTYTWSSDNESVATVDSSGTVTAVSVGRAVVTAKAKSSDVKASCSFVVLPREYVKDDQGLAYFYDQDTQGYGVLFQGDRSITSINVPNVYMGTPIKHILPGCFAELKALATVTLPTTEFEIDDGAFVNNVSLTTLKRGESIWGLTKVNGTFVNQEDVEIGDRNFVEAPIASISLGGENAKGDINVIAKGTTGIIDSIEYDIKMNEVSPYGAKGTLSLNGETNAPIATGAHGIYREVTLKFLKGETVVDTLELDQIPVSAKVYNVAMLTATYPTTIFTLKAPEITNNGEIPTYTLLERYAAFNWDQLQWNIRELPNISHEDATHASNSRFFGAAHEWMKDYIADLYEANPESKFHFFFTDLSIDYFYYTVVAQGIEEERYDLTMLSDGTASAAILSSIYGTWSQGNPSRAHQQMMDSIAKVKDHLFYNGWDPDYIKANLANINGTRADYDGKPNYWFANHAYSTLCLLDNCEWWLNRLRAGENLSAINKVDPEFVTKILGTEGLKQNIYANSLLAALSEEDQAKFKAIFHFDSDSFDESRKQEKKIMVILGTSWSGEADTLYGLMKATMLLYGDAYDYYYKPHPGWPTSTCPERNAIFDRLRAEGFEFEELDGAVAAEIIMYFNSDIYLAGYSSTTYASLDDTNEGMGACDWTANTEEYTEYMYSYLSLVGVDDPLRAQYGLDADKTYYVVHYNENKKSVYDLHDTAIICLENSSVTYYKNGSVVQ